MGQRLSGSVCLITGASAEIGKACALALAKEGASLVLTARRKHRLDELGEAIQSAGSRAVEVVEDGRGRNGSACRYDGKREIRGSAYPDQQRRNGELQTTHRHQC